MVVLPRLYPLIAPLTARVLGKAEPDIEIVQGDETEEVTPPAFLGGMLERATGAAIATTLARQMEMARSRTAHHAAVRRVIFHDALVYPAGFATPRHAIQFTRLPLGRAQVGPVREVDELRYCYGYNAWRFFGHWLSESVPSALIDAGRGTLWMPPQPDWRHARAYLSVFALHPVTTPVVHARRLIRYLDASQGSHKRARYAALRARLHELYGGGDAERLVYLRRGATGARRVIRNEEALMEALAARGWAIADVAQDSVADLQRLLCCARVAISMEGSHTDHAHLSMRPGSALVHLIPQDRFSLRHVGLSQAQGVRSGGVVLRGAQPAGYHADLDEILRTVDLTLAEG